MAVDTNKVWLLGTSSTGLPLAASGKVSTSAAPAKSCRVRRATICSRVPKFLSVLFSARPLAATSNCSSGANYSQVITISGNTVFASPSLTTVSLTMATSMLAFEMHKVVASMSDPALRW